MAKSSQPTSTPARPPTLKKQSSSTSSSKNQSSILGFFSKTTPNGTTPTSNGTPKPSTVVGTDNLNKAAANSKKPASRKKSGQNVTPVPSSDGPDVSSSQEVKDETDAAQVDNGLPSPATPAKSKITQAVNGTSEAAFSSPSRKVIFASNHTNSKG